MSEKFNKWAKKWWYTNGWAGAYGGEEKFAADAYEFCKQEVLKILEKHKTFGLTDESSDAIDLDAIEEIEKL